jgi:hypothetical protein
MMKLLARSRIKQYAFSFQRSRAKMNSVVTNRKLAQPEAAVEFFADRLIGDFERVVKK